VDPGGVNPKAEPRPTVGIAMGPSGVLTAMVGDVAAEHTTVDSNTNPRTPVVRTARFIFAPL
jgi:hypothetical protein